MLMDVSSMDFGGFGGNRFLLDGKFGPGRDCSFDAELSTANKSSGGINKNKVLFFFCSCLCACEGVLPTSYIVVGSCCKPERSASFPKNVRQGMTSPGIV